MVKHRLDVNYRHDAPLGLRSQKRYGYFVTGRTLCQVCTTVGFKEDTTSVPLEPMKNMPTPPTEKWIRPYESTETVP